VTRRRGLIKLCAAGDLVQGSAQIVAQVGPDAVAAQPSIEPSPAMAASWPDAHETIDMPGAHAAALTLPGPSLRLTDARGDVRPLEDIEREVIRFAIAHYREQMSEVARRLQIGRSTLYRKLEGLGLDDKGSDTKVNVTVAAE